MSRAAAARQAAAPRVEGLDDQTIREWTRRTRAARGLPPTIKDRATLARLVALALGPGPGPQGDGKGNGP